MRTHERGDWAYAVGYYLGRYGPGFAAGIMVGVWLGYLAYRAWEVLR